MIMMMTTIFFIPSIGVYAINFMIQLISSLALLAYIVYVLKCLGVAVKKRCHKPEYRLINGPHENTYEGSDSNEEF